MITRTQLSHTPSLYYNFYAQFMSPTIEVEVLRRIGKDAILNSKDQHFNDIPDKLWDEVSGVCKEDISIRNLALTGKSTWSLEDGVGAAKTFAKAFREEFSKV